MQFIYNNDAGKIGIYEIRNTHKNRSYVGQTVKSFKERWAAHKYSLLSESKSRGSTNIKLKCDFKKCYQEVGNDNFLEFYILEVVEDKTKLNEREIFWISEFKKQEKEIYNFTEGGFGLTEETLQKISESRKNNPLAHAFKKGHIPWIKGRKMGPSSKFGKTFEEFYGEEKAAIIKIRMAENRPPSTSIFKSGQTYEERFGAKAEEIKQKIRKAHLGKNLSQEHKDKIKKANTDKNYLRGKTYEEVFGIEKAAVMKEVASKNSKARPSNRKGCKHSPESIEKMKLTHKQSVKYGKDSRKAKIYDNIRLIAPDGQVFTKIECLKEFCLAHNLSSSRICLLLQGKAKTHKKWKLG